MKVFINGKFVDEKKAAVSVFDHGLLYGDGVFEGIRVYRGRVFKLKEHIDRCGRARIILARCDSDEAVRFGQSLGITMYQGRYIDKLLTSESRVG